MDAASIGLALSLKQITNATSMNLDRCHCTTNDGVHQKLSLSISIGGDTDRGRAVFGVPTNH